MKPFDLENSPKIQSGFKPPEGYFDGLSDKIMSQLPVIESQSKIIPLHVRRRNTILAVAAVLVLGLMIPFYNNFQKPAVMEQPDSAEIENYLSYQTDISQYDLANMLTSNDVDKMDSDLKLSNSDIEEVLTTNNNLENYLTD